MIPWKNAAETTKPKIGLFFIAGESWWEAGICNATTGQFAGFIQKVERDVQSLTDALSRDHVVVSSGLLHSSEQALREARRFCDEKIDVIVCCPIIWTNDPPVVAFLQNAPRVPFLLLAYNPYKDFPTYFRIEEWLRASSPVSVQQSSNILRRLGWDYDISLGNETEQAFLDEVRAFVRAAWVKRSLVGTHIGVLPSPCRVVISTWVDEFFLLEKFGVELQFIPVDTFAAIVRSVPATEAGEYVKYLKSNFPVVGVTDEVLQESALQALAFVKLVKENQLSGIALEDFNTEIYRVLGFRPHLYHPDIGAQGCTIGFEADVLGVLTTIIVSRLAGRMGMFNEFFSVDRATNTVLMGHPGHGEIRVGEESTIMVTPDLEFSETQKRGAWISYRAKPGLMSFLNFTPEYGKLKATAFTAESLPGPRVMEGYSHMLVRPACDVVKLFKDIVRRGLIQHWGTVHGDLTRELQAFSRIMSLDLHIYA
jgi:L-fucose isomerase-like protein